jgi:hypothetical protein
MPTWSAAMDDLLYLGLGLLLFGLGMLAVREKAAR